MPWKVYQEGGQYCVHKVKPDGGKGAKVPGGCHGSKADAEKHKGALYHNVEGVGAMKGIIKRFLPIRAEGASLVTIPNVPIVSTGIEYPLASGPMTFTEDDLRDAVRASEDPNVNPPRLKIAYGGPHQESITEPAFGSCVNLRLGDNDQTIYGDFVGVPRWLAEILPVAYPSRSVEGNRNITTVGGNKYRMVIDKVALLGVHHPGVTSLADLPMLYGEEVPEGTEIAAAGVNGAVNIEDVRRSYYTKLGDSGPEYAWWWVRAMELEPDGGYLVVDDDSGNLYRVGFNVEEDGVNFADPQQVKIRYDALPEVPQEQLAATFVASMADVRAGMTVYATRAESRPFIQATQEGGQTVDVAELAKLLGLPEDATEEQVSAKIRENNQALLEQGGTGESGQAGTSTPSMEPSSSDTSSTVGPNPESPPAQVGGGAGAPGGAPVEPPAEPEPPEEVEGGRVLMDKTMYDQLIAGAQAGTRLEAEMHKTKRENAVDGAIKAGKLPRASREHYLTLYASDPDGTQATLDALQPGHVPLEPVGSGGTNENGDVEGLPTEWFGGAIEAARARGEQPNRVTMAQEA
jgi:hypothetical protein